LLGFYSLLAIYPASTQTPISGPVLGQNKARDEQEDQQQPTAKAELSIEE
jgi:hypothetical protein